MKLPGKIGVVLGASVLAVGIATVAWSAGASSQTSSQPQNLHPQVAKTDAFIDTSTEAKYTAITPCRIADTRSGGGALAAGATRSFVVAGGGAGFAGQGGTAGGCAIPSAATAVAATVVAVDETGPGFLRTWPAGGTAPASSFLNFAPPTIVSSGVTLTIKGSVNIAAGAAGTDLVVDVQGYYIKPMWALVNADGSLGTNSRATGSTELTTGQYEIDFDRDVSGCAYAASTDETIGTNAIVAPRNGVADGVFVATNASGGTNSANAFYVTVTC
jgi:hypothetical protein